MNTYYEVPRLTNKLVAGFLASAMVFVSVLPVLALPRVAEAAANVVIDSINGEPPTGHCIAGPLEVVVHGTRGSNGGPYSVIVGNGFSTSTPTSVGKGADGAFGPVTINYIPTGSSNALYINLYHGSPTGEDSHILVINQCVAPPTQGVVIVEKNVINDNNGNALASDFTLHINGTSFSGSSEGTDFLLDPGVYPITEDEEAGYTKTSTVCVGNNATTTNGSVTVVAGKNYVCTVTNDDNVPTTGTLTLAKTVIKDNGGTAIDTDWTLSASGPTPISGAEGDSEVTSAVVQAGVYNLSESGGPLGYSSSGSWVCDANLQNDSDTVTVAIGEDVTCTITNNDIAPKLTLEKILITNNGGTAIRTDFVLKANGTGSNDLVGAHGVTSGPTFQADTLVLSEETESFPAGYSASDWVCVGGDQDGSSITLGVGEEATCTVTNNDNAPSLTLVKQVVNDNGGTAQASAWTLTATGPTSFSGAGPSISSDGDFRIGTYNLSESGGPNEGYTVSDWVCVGGNQIDGDTISLGLGSSATCTITNNDIAPSLTLEKEVINDNGGEAQADEWLLFADGPTAFSGPGPSVSSDASFDAGTYTLSELGASGYSPSSWSCVVNDNEPVSGSQVTLGLGDVAVCTITNDDVSATLTVIKEVNNNDGGSLEVGDFNLYVDGSPVQSGVTIELNPGQYLISEDDVEGYVGTMSGDCTEDGLVSIGLGGEYTCVITNDDIAPGLTVIKQITNDNGGTLDVGDVTLRVNGNPVTSGISSTLIAGDYVVSEDPIFGYTSSFGGDCDANGEVTLSVGETKICYLFNNDIAPSLTLVKEVTNDNGGNAGASEWTLFASGASVGATNLSGAGGAASDSTFKADTYTLSESVGPSGYASGNWSCSGDVENVGESITLGVGQSANCTLVNDDIAPSLTLIKFLDNGEEGDANASDWTLTATGEMTLEGSTPVTSGSDFQAGLYSLSESGPGHYASSGWSCVINDGAAQEGSAVALEIGDVAVCSITNTFTPFSSDVSITKSVNDSTPDQNQSVVYTITATNSGPDGVDGVTISDFLPSGATYVSDDGSGAYDSQTGIWNVGVLNNGESKSLNITVSVTAGTGEEVTNTASLSQSGNDDPNSDNNSADAVFKVNTPEPVSSGGGGGGGGNTLCSNTRDDDGDGLADALDPGCHSDGNANNPNSYVPSDNNEGEGSVLGAFTGQVLGESCGLYMDRFIRSGIANDVDQVTKLQNFLNKWMNAGLTVNGIYDAATLSAVMAFQAKYADEVLTPWNLSGPTGIVYQTTLRWINMLECPELSLQIPSLVPWSQNPSVPQIATTPVTKPETPRAQAPAGSDKDSDTDNGEDLTASASEANEASGGGFWNFLKGLFGR